MREASVEEHLRQRVRELGGRCIKLSPLGAVGIPDRLVLIPRGRVWFVELKRPKGGRYSRLQNVWYAWLTENGFNAARIKSKEEVDAFARDNARAD